MRRALKRVLQVVAGLLILAVVLTVLGVTAVWGHFWDFRVGDPSSEACGSCHVMESYVESQQVSHLLASGHAVEGIECTDCHDYGIEEQFNDTLAYLQADYQEPLPRARYGMETCFQCHEHGSYEQIAMRTTDLGVTDAQAKGHSANPHQSPHYSDLECHSCHRVHSESTLLCSECHSYEFSSRYFGVELEATAEAVAASN